jgi:hypothetical protein
MRSSICAQYKFAAIILASKQTSLVTSGVTLGFPVFVKVLVHNAQTVAVIYSSILDHGVNIGIHSKMLTLTVKIISLMCTAKNHKTDISLTITISSHPRRELDKRSIIRNTLIDPKVLQCSVNTA